MLSLSREIRGICLFWLMIGQDAFHSSGGVFRKCGGVDEPDAPFENRPTPFDRRLATMRVRCVIPPTSTAAILIAAGRISRRCSLLHSRKTLSISRQGLNRTKNDGR